jgi:trehalose 6-phosphate synthase/phosphatase
MLGLEREIAGMPVEVLSGSKVIEIRQQGINKGAVASRLVAAIEPQTVVVAMGDDRTDEDLFTALPATAFTIHVGPQPSRARYRINDPAAARRLLEKLLSSDSGISSSRRSRATSL